MQATDLFEASASRARHNSDAFRVGTHTHPQLNQKGVPLGPNARLDRDPAARKYVPVADGPPRDGADRAAVT
jgi:hypothetical protein